MKLTHRQLTGAAILAVLALTPNAWCQAALAQSPPPASTDAQQPDEPPGVGIICLWGFVSVAEEVGSRCFPGQDKEFQSELHQSVARIDRFVLRNSDITAEGIISFKKDQAHVGGPKSFLCQGDPLMIYKSFRNQGAATIRSMTEKIVSRPGVPTWGTCA